MKLELLNISEYEELYDIITDAMEMYDKLSKINQGYPAELKYENLYHTASFYLQRLDKLKENPNA